MNSEIAIEEIIQVLQHRNPFLLIDRIKEYEYGKYVVGVKNVSVNEPWAAGHFPEHPVYPGALIIESSAQTGGFLFYDPEETDRKKGGMLACVDSFKFVRAVYPGDQLVIKTELISRFGKFVKVRATATVDGKRAAEGELTYVTG